MGNNGMKYKNEFNRFIKKNKIEELLKNDNLKGELDNQMIKLKASTSPNLVYFTSPSKIILFDSLKLKILAVGNSIDLNNDTKFSSEGIIVPSKENRKIKFYSFWLKKHFQINFLCEELVNLSIRIEENFRCLGIQIVIYSNESQVKYYFSKKTKKILKKPTRKTLI